MYGLLLEVRDVWLLPEDRDVWFLLEEINVCVITRGKRCMGYY